MSGGSIKMSALLHSPRHLLILFLQLAIYQSCAAVLTDITFISIDACHMSVNKMQKYHCTIWPVSVVGRNEQRRRLYFSQTEGKGKGRVFVILWHCLHESDSSSAALYNLGSWLAWANDTVLGATWATSDPITHKAPQYLMDCCIPISDVASRRHLRSASRHDLVVTRQSQHVWSMWKRLQFIHVLMEKCSK